MLFDVIAFDADDTLWHSENFYQETQSAWTTVLAAYGVEGESALETLHRVEVANLPTFGYGIKGFTISMVEAAIQTTGGKISTADIQAIIGLGRTMAGHEVLLLENSAESVARLAQTHTLMLITKGDLLDQERKISASGLAGYFKMVEIVSDKTPETYAALLRKHGFSAERFLMIGNSLRSDILPVLELGGWAVYVPYALTWAHESAAVPTTANGRFYEIPHLGLIPSLVAQIENHP